MHNFILSTTQLILTISPNLSVIGKLEFVKIVEVIEVISSDCAKKTENVQKRKKKMLLNNIKNSLECLIKFEASKKIQTHNSFLHRSISTQANVIL